MSSSFSCLEPRLVRAANDVKRRDNSFEALSTTPEKKFYIFLEKNVLYLYFLEEQQLGCMFILSGLWNILCAADGSPQKGMEYISRRLALVKYLPK